MLIENIENHIDFTDFYIVNPAYDIRSDIRRTIITNSRGVSNALIKDDTITTGFSWIWNPIIAIFFSYFDGSNDLNTTIKALAKDFKIEESEIKKFVSDIISMKEKDIIFWKRLSIRIPIPKRLLIKKEANCPNRAFDTDSFIIKKENWDLSSARLYIPNSIGIMLNNKCYTDCIYCYANKDTKPKTEMSWKRVIELIQEADKIGVGEITFNGGDFFMYKYWREVLKEALKYHYEPYISTKFPLSQEQVKELKKIGLKKIQISFDSDDPQQLQMMLNIPQSYHSKMLDTFKFLEEADIKVDVKSVITKYNSEISDIKKLIERLKQYKNISHLSIAPAEASLYKTFENYKADAKKLDKIDLYIRSFQGQITPTLKCGSQGYTTDQFLKSSIEEKKNKMLAKNMCSGNFSSIFILPDGQVGICEQLYWHPAFIIGDVTKDSIMDVWNSQKAKDLFAFPQSNFPQESPCRKCDIFAYCRYQKGVCWRNIFFAYGKENIYNPDPECPYAPKPILKYYHEI